MTDLSSIRVLIAGDVMLDSYWFGDADRISPEAPVPVVRVTKKEDRLGGAGNVARNITSIGAQACLYSIVGNDDAGRKVLKLLNEANIDPIIALDHQLDTTVKLRVVARQQQMVRCDFETRPNFEILSAHLEKFKEHLPCVQAVILSDYGKGGLSHISEMIEHCRSLNIPILIDPKGNDYRRYQGATMITPNRSELKEVIGEWHSEQELSDKAQALRQQLNLQYLLLTRSEEGMTLYSSKGDFSICAQAREVFDVSGAGDTVIAVMATMIARGLPIEECVRIANIAGGIVVGKLGTAAVTASELFG